MKLHWGEAVRLIIGLGSSPCKVSPTGLGFCQDEPKVGSCAHVCLFVPVRRVHAKPGRIFLWIHKLDFQRGAGLSTRRFHVLCMAHPARTLREGLQLLELCPELWAVCWAES